jgi:hypothetical protein
MFLAAAGRPYYTGPAMKELKYLLSGLAAGFCLMTGEVSATTWSFTSSSAFNLALIGRPVTIEGFENYAANFAIPAGTVLNGVRYNSFPGSTLGRIDNNYNHFGTQSLALKRASDPNPNKSFFNPGESLSISFIAPVYAMGIFFNANFTNPGSLGILTTPVGTVTTGGTPYDVGTFYFAGIISDVPFSTVTIGSNSKSSSSYNLDNLTFTHAAAAVPDRLGFLTPAVMLGFLCACGYRWRRRFA